MRGYYRRSQGGPIQDAAILVEMKTHGPFVKVTAMDQITLTEVSIVGDASKGEDELRRLAAQKLRYVLNRDRDAKDVNRQDRE